MTGITMQVAGLLDAYDEEGNLVGSVPLFEGGQPRVVKAMSTKAFLKVWGALGMQIVESMAAAEAPGNQTTPPEGSGE